MLISCAVMYLAINLKTLDYVCLYAGKIRLSNIDSCMFHTRCFTMANAIASNITPCTHGYVESEQHTLIPSPVSMQRKWRKNKYSSRIARCQRERKPPIKSQYNAHDLGFSKCFNKIFPISEFGSTPLHVILSHARQKLVNFSWFHNVCGRYNRSDKTETNQLRFRIAYRWAQSHFIRISREKTPRLANERMKKKKTMRSLLSIQFTRIGDSTWKKKTKKFFLDKNGQTKNDSSTKQWLNNWFRRICVNK